MTEPFKRQINDDYTNLGDFSKVPLIDSVEDLRVSSLENHFLIAMPNLLDPMFRHTVTYICEHNRDGAMGLIINHPIDINVGELLSKIDVNTDRVNNAYKNPVYNGGPVQTDRGFVLHSPLPALNSSLKLSEQIMVTTSKDVLEAIAVGQIPDKFLICLGYSGWTAGQLEQEIAQNSWLTIPADPELIFDTPNNMRWQRAAERLGIDIRQISLDVGHA